MPGMAATSRRAAAPDPSHFRHSYAKDSAQLMRRLSRMEGQVRGIARMIEREGCVRTAAERGEADKYVDEVIDVVRRTLGRPLRSTTRTT